MKTTPIMERTTYCPKCGNKTLRASINHLNIPGRELFCDTCHEYIPAQVAMYLDVADYFELQTYEPHWSSIGERGEAYQVVTNMFLGIEEWMIEEDNSVDTGALHV